MHLTREGYIMRACAQLSLRIEHSSTEREDETSIPTTPHECVRRGAPCGFSARFARSVYLASAPFFLTLLLPFFKRTPYRLYSCKSTLISAAPRDTRIDSPVTQRKSCNEWLILFLSLFLTAEFEAS